MTFKVGQVLYRVRCDEENGKVEIDEWIVRTIRGGWVHAIWKAEYVTWGKRSTKHGDFGWLPNIPAWCRQKWRPDGKPHSLFTTKLQAIRDELKGTRLEFFDTPDIGEKAIRTLRSMETKAKK